MMSDIEWAGAFIVAALATARITRFVVQDPATLKARLWWGTHAHGFWRTLPDCHHCVAAWASALVVGSGAILGFAPAWWLVCSWLAVAWTGAMLLELGSGS